MRKKGVLPYVTAWMELEGILLVDKLERERQILHDITICGIFKKTIKLIETENRKVVVTGWGRREMRRGW